MATITNIRIYTQSKAVPNAGYIAIDKVMMECNTIVAMGGDVRYVLGVVPMENIVVDTPSMPEECGCNTANANIFATLIKGVDGITPDMSDYYDKGQVDNKLSTKQDVISDIDNIRRNALKGATALQQSNVDGELSLGSRNPVQNATVTEAVSQISEIVGLMYNVIGGLEETVANKQDTIADLTTIRDGAAKGATALQSSDVDSEVSETSTNPIQNKAVAGVFSEILGQLDVAFSIVDERFNSKQDKLVSGENIKTINGEPIVGEGNIEIGGGTADLEGYATEEYVDNAVAEVNVKGEDGYVYSNGEKVDMRFTRSLIPVGTSIPAKANLNTVAYLKVGKYYCSLNADAKTITNCPTANAFMMEVFNPLSTVVDNEVDSTYVYRIRILTEYSTGIQYVQYCTVGSTANKWTYDSWYVCPRTKFTLNSNKKGGTAAIGSKAQGVYVDSTGTLQKMTYSLNKTVPANAVFTDTNTKVTAVGNHYTPAENADEALNAPEGEVVVGLKRDAAGHVVGVMSTPMSGGGSGGGGITKESDPVFSASPAATITEEKMAEWDKGATAVQPETLAGYASEGYVDAEVKALGDSLAEVASSGSYNDLQDKPTIPSAINIAGTNYTPGDSGIIDLNRAFLYRKPSGGIPKEDLSSEVQTSLRDAEAYKGTVTGVKINGTTKSPSNGVVDLGDIPTSIPSEVYIADFTMEDLYDGMNNGTQVECDIQNLITAMNANKVILVREGEDSYYKGVCILNGYAEDLLYFSIVTVRGEILWCDGTPYDVQKIDGSVLHLRNFDGKQDALVSGENIKTINGESILGEGDMVVGKVTYFSEEDSLELSPGVVWMRRGRVVNSVQITGFASNWKTYEEYAYHFNTGTIADGNAVKLILPAGVKYANKEIFDALESDTHYELSVVRSIGFVKAVLTAFK